MFVPRFLPASQASLNLAEIRSAINGQRKVRIAYTNEGEEATERIIHPLGLFFWGKLRTLGAWCELRRGFRNFPLDRIRSLDELEESFETAPGQSLDDYFDDLMG